MELQMIFPLTSRPLFSGPYEAVPQDETMPPIPVRWGENGWEYENGQALGPVSIYRGWTYASAKKTASEIILKEAENETDSFVKLVMKYCAKLVEGVR